MPTSCVRTRPRMGGPLRQSAPQGFETSSVGR
jgi:hypothetical protein